MKRILVMTDRNPCSLAITAFMFFLLYISGIALLNKEEAAIESLDSDFTSSSSCGIRMFIF